MASYQIVLRGFIRLGPSPVTVVALGVLLVRLDVFGVIEGQALLGLDVDGLEPQ